jgi:hypothetical protein
MNWNLLENSKFYFAGSLTWIESLKRFRYEVETSAMFSLKSLLNIDEDAGVVNNLLLFQFEVALPLLPKEEQNFLLTKFQEAYKKVKELSATDPTDGYVIFSPDVSYVDYHADNLFVYVVSNFDNDEYYFANKVIEKKNLEFFHGERRLRYINSTGQSCIYYVFNGVKPK